MIFNFHNFRSIELSPIKCHMASVAFIKQGLRTEQSMNGSFIGKHVSDDRGCTHDAVAAAAAQAEPHLPVALGGGAALRAEGALHGQRHVAAGPAGARRPPRPAARRLARMLRHGARAPLLRRARCAAHRTRPTTATCTLRDA